MDLSDCDISGIAISGGSCEMRANLEQAAQLGVLLAGVVLVEAALPRETN